MTFICKYCEKKCEDCQMSYCMFRCDFIGCNNCLATHTVENHIDHKDD